MSLCLDLGEIQEHHAPQTGGKAFALAHLLQHNFSVPDGLCILADAYRRFVDATSLAERIRLELSRKEFRQMRWEELWDTALRIRYMFDRTPFPRGLESVLTEKIEDKLGKASVAVRSSAIGEDSQELSFAGLHESVLNVKGTTRILEQVKRVWASLWSDASLLYRQELNLEVETSAMAVLVQFFVPGERSGVVFSQSPLDPDVAVIEAVAGLAKGLVDGTVEPERWTIHRRNETVTSHIAYKERRRVVPDVNGVRVVDDITVGTELLSEQAALQVFTAARDAESLFGIPQDVEWTFGSKGLQILQSRPVTAKKQDNQEKRLWNLSLRRSFQNLSELREKIENSILPGMREEADQLSERDLEQLSNQELAGEIELRQAALDRWTGVYWDDLIPFAHGMRLFGQVYNDAVQPQDPFAFVALLRPERLESIERNLLIRKMAEYIRQQPRLRERLQKHALSQISDNVLRSQVASYQHRYGNLLGIQADQERLEEHLRTLLLEMSDFSKPLNEERRISNREELEQQYLSKFEEKDRERAEELLDLGRASYRIRDDDNIYLDRFKALLREAEELGRVRLSKRALKNLAELPGDELIRALQDSKYRPQVFKEAADAGRRSEIAARQLIGQPASEGIATGVARVVLQPEELFNVKKGEILVCDSIDPAMTFVAPLTAGIVERRGGMLIHGAIIAREYGIPCVTGIPDATERIASGDRLTVDGYLGIVMIDTRLKKLAKELSSLP